MKIGFLTPEFPHQKTGASGGIGTSILNLATGLNQLGHQVSIIVYGQDKDEVFEENGITFYKIKNVKVTGLSFYFTQKKIQKTINNLINQQKIEIVEAPDWTGFTAFVNLKCPLIIRLNGSDTYFCYLDKRPVKWLNKFLEKRALLKANAIISVSKFTGDLTNKVFCISRDFDVIPNAIDVEKFIPQTSINNNTILYFGTLIRKKGLIELPQIFNQVFAENPKAKLILVGKDASDISTKSVSTWSIMKPLFYNDALKNVIYKGSVPYSQIKTEIEQATVCVFPTFAEALPVSWLEAMAMQKPIVASNIGWAPEIIDSNENGFLESPLNHSEYAKKINQILSDEQLQHNFGVEARKKVIEKFSIEVVAKQSISFYSKHIK